MDVPALQSSSLVSIAPGVTARPDDLRFHFARSGGPGGQNVNKVNSKAELRVRPEALLGLSGAALHRLTSAQANRMTVDGDLLIVADSSRSQFANRQACLEKLRGYVEAALKEPKIRRKTRPSAGSWQRRLDSKKRAAASKRNAARTITNEFRSDIPPRSLRASSLLRRVVYVLRFCVRSLRRGARAALP